MASQLPFKSLNEIVKIQLDHITANSPIPLNTPVGAMLTAIAYATALVSLVLQRSIQALLKLARLSTASDEDVDTFVEDFGLTRLSGAPSSGAVTFARYVAAVTSVPIPIGSKVETSDSVPVSFTVVADLSNPNYSSSSQAYFLNAGQTSVNVTVVCDAVGTTGNVLAGAINTITSSLAGIDTVSNGNAFSNGVNEESDASLKTRFVLYIQSLSKATKTAIAAAIASVQSNLVYVILENQDNNGTTTNGLFTVAVDDGSGVPNSTLLTQIDSAIDNVRPIGVRKATQWATVKNLLVAVNIQYDSTLVSNLLTLRTAIKNAILTYVNTLSVNKTAHFGKIFQAIWNSLSPGDSVVTTIAASPVSDVNNIYVVDTTGFSVGQLIQITGYALASGANPTIKSISDKKITLSAPLVTSPPSGTTVTGFSVTPGQIVAVENLTLSTIVATTTLASGSTSSVLKVVDRTNFAVNNLIVVDGYVPNPAVTATFIPNVTVITNTAGVTADITINPGLGIIGADGSWTATAPPAGTKVYVATATWNGAVSAAVGGKLDITAGLVEVLRSSLDRIFIGFYR